MGLISSREPANTSNSASPNHQNDDHSSIFGSTSPSKTYVWKQQQENQHRRQASVRSRAAMPMPDHNELDERFQKILVSCCCYSSSSFIIIFSWVAAFVGVFPSNVFLCSNCTFSPMKSFENGGHIGLSHLTLRQIHVILYFACFFFCFRFHSIKKLKSKEIMCTTKSERFA